MLTRTLTCSNEIIAGGLWCAPRMIMLLSEGLHKPTAGGEGVPKVAGYRSGRGGRGDSHSCELHVLHVVLTSSQTTHHVTAHTSPFGVTFMPCNKICDMMSVYRNTLDKCIYPREQSRCDRSTDEREAHGSVHLTILMRCPDLSSSKSMISYGGICSEIPKLGWPARHGHGMSVGEYRSAIFFRSQSEFMNVCVCFGTPEPETEAGTGLAVQTQSLPLPKSRPRPLCLLLQPLRCGSSIHRSCTLMSSLAHPQRRVTSQTQPSGGLQCERKRLCL